MASTVFRPHHNHFIHLQTPLSLSLNDLITELDTIEEKFNSLPYSKKFPYITKKLATLRQECLTECQNLQHSSVDYISLQKKAADIKIEIDSLLTPVDHANEKNDRVNQLTADIARMQLQTTQFLKTCSAIALPYIQAVGAGVAASIESCADTILHPVDSVIAPIFEHLDNMETLERYEPAAVHNPFSTNPNITQVHEIRKKCDRQKKDLQSIWAIMTQGTGPQRTQLATTAVTSYLLPIAINKFAKWVPRHINRHTRLVETTITTTHDYNGHLRYFYAVDQETVIVYVDFLKLEGASAGLSTPPLGLLKKTLDILQNLATSKGASKLLMQCDPINPKLASFLKKRFYSYGDLPVFHQDVISMNPTRSFPVFDIPLPQKNLPYTPSGHYQNSLALAMSTTSFYGQSVLDDQTSAGLV